MKKIIFILILVMFTIFTLSNYSSAQTADQLQSQISNANSQIEQLNKEIAILSNQIAQTGDKKNTLANTIKGLVLQRDKFVKERQQTEKKITATGLIINNLNIEINTKNNTLAKSKESLSSLVRSLYQEDNQSFIQKMLLQDNLKDASREYNNILSLNDNLKKNIDEISLQKENLSISKGSKEIEQNNLNILKKKLIAKENAILTTKKEKDTLLTQTKNQESNYKKLLQEQQKRKDAFDKSIEDYEAQLQFILNPNSIPKSSSNPLSWPLNNILVTSPYGARWGSFHYGVDFRASIGTPVKAMAEGVVLGTGNTDIACKGASFGNWVFIKYNNGLSSTYGHLSEIKATVGQKVHTGDIVALSGNTGYSMAPHLHVSVYASGGVNVATVPSKACNGKIFTQPIAALSAYLNPSLYLPKMLASMIKK